LAIFVLIFSPHYHSAPSLPRLAYVPFRISDFVEKLTMRKLESWGYPPVKTPWGRDRSLSRFGMIPA